ncbi:MAG: hypothetical protein ACOY4H_01195 [Thermodesulfobacteriota bacterium]
MAHVKQQQHGGSFADFLRLIAGQATDFAVECVRVEGEEHPWPPALLLLDPALPPAAKRELRRRVGADGELAPNVPLLEKQSGPAEMDSLRCRVDRELDRVKKSRIPCGLLLIRFNGTAIERALPIIEETIGPDSRPALYDEWTLAVLQTGMNRRSLMAMAERLYQRCAARLTRNVRIACALGTARDLAGADEFIARTARELARTDDKQRRVFSAFAEEEQDHSCQVTAEERAQLFSFRAGRPQ